MPDRIPNTFFAPCGMNCFICYKHLSHKNSCPGCREDAPSKQGHCRDCKIKECAKSKNLEYCFQCSDFPCKRVKNLDKTYRTRYLVSLTENSLYIKENTLKSFFEIEAVKWRCSICGGVISVHDGVCSECGKARK